ncbi:hypothetical protein SAY87_005456 [Trapa incisa]|uniref:Uncharacterized protein n=1 Tax=Trapa incisa TaxID=236973 RepID=A0AAN7Q745_9MYRT|nr:hypothetical protein SAY87_005456 [Trapa incisa]
MLEQAPHDSSVECLPLLSRFQEAKDPPLKVEESTLRGGGEERFTVALNIGLPGYHSDPHPQHLPHKSEVLDEIKEPPEKAPECKKTWPPLHEHGYPLYMDQQKRFWIPTPAQILVGAMHSLNAHKPDFGI